MAVREAARLSECCCWRCDSFTVLLWRCRRAVGRMLAFVNWRVTVGRRLAGCSPASLLPCHGDICLTAFGLFGRACRGPSLTFVISRRASHLHGKRQERRGRKKRFPTSPNSQPAPADKFLPPRRVEGSDDSAQRFASRSSFPFLFFLKKPADCAFLTSRLCSSLRLLLFFSLVIIRTLIVALHRGVISFLASFAICGCASTSSSRWRGKTFLKASSVRTDLPGVSVTVLP